MAGSNRRTSLPDVGITHLELSEEGRGTRSYELEGEIGRGGSCIVYKAKTADDGLTAGQSKIVKEFFPEGLGAIRLDNGSLKVSADRMEEFQVRLERFARGIERFGSAFELDALGGLGTLPRPDFIGEANGTLYSVSDPWKGVPLSACNAESVRDVAREMAEVCRELDALHRAGLLYLDCKPSNLYRYETPDGEAHVALFDFDTVERVSDLQGGSPPTCSSFSPGWAPPEQKDSRRIRELGPAADVYAVGATFLWLLTGLRATPDVAEAATGAYGLDWWSEARVGLQDEFRQNPSVNVIGPLDAIARGALAHDPRERLTLDELRGLFLELAKMTDSNEYTTQTVLATGAALGVAVLSDGEKTRALLMDLLGPNGSEGRSKERMGTQEPASAASKQAHSPNPSSLSMASFGDLIAKGWTAMEIAERLVENDRKLYPEEDDENEGSPETWASYLSSYPETFRYALNPDGEIVGNWSFLAVSEEIHGDALRSGTLLESTFSPENTEFLFFKGDYIGYLLNLSLNEGYASQENYSLLFESLSSQIAALAERGIFFKKWYVNIFRGDHIALFKRLGFKFQCKHDVTGDLYMKDVESLAEGSAAIRDDRLRGLYGGHYGIDA